MPGKAHVGNYCPTRDLTFPFAMLGNNRHRNVLYGKGQRKDIRLKFWDISNLKILDY